MKKSLLLLTLGLAGFLQAATAATIADALAAIDPATGAAKDTTTAFSLTGIVSSRATLADGKILAFVHPVGAQGLPVLVSAADSAKILPRNEISFTGTLAAGPFGWAVLAVKDGSLTVAGDNKPFGASTPCGTATFADASALAGKFVQLTNVIFAAGNLSVKDGVKVKSADGKEVSLLVSTAADGRTAPEGAVNVFGVPVKVDGSWKLLAARFLPANIKATQALAEKHTCITCHNADTKVVGPSYREVAQKYRNEKDAVTKFIAQMNAGGQGKWGAVPMPSFKDKVTPAEMKQLSEWVFSYRWDWILAE